MMQRTQVSNINVSDRNDGGCAHNLVCHEWCAMTWDVSEGNSFRTTAARMDWKMRWVPPVGPGGGGGTVLLCHAYPLKSS